jgi:DNA-binding winged helix-turn-helix (wHTH) protein
MNPSHTPTPPIRFGDFELLPESGELKKAGTRVRLSGQAFDTLVLLVEARGEIVSREELQKALWSDSSFGDFEHGLNAAINTFAAPWATPLSTRDMSRRLRAADTGSVIH